MYYKMTNTAVKIHVTSSQSSNKAQFKSKFLILVNFNKLITLDPVHLNSINIC